MAGGTTNKYAEGRRIFLGMAVDRYRELPEDGRLVRPSVDAASLAQLLCASGYEHALPGMGNYWTSEHVRLSLSEWLKDTKLGADDVVVFYFAGHGMVADRDRHYLMCWNSNEEDPASTALATEDLVRILTRTGLRNLLIVLDTCYGGAGAADGSQIVLRTLARQFNDNGPGGVWLLSSSRAKDEAGDGTFVDVLIPALTEVQERTGQRQRYLDLLDVVEEVNRRFQRQQVRQRAEIAAGVVTGLAPFLKNERYRSDLPTEDTDLELQRLLSKRDLHEHFGPRSRGVEFDSEPGLYFHGRDEILGELVSWLTAPNKDGKGRVVTGSPGCGKSAVLGRIVAMSDPEYRRHLLHEPAPAAAGVTAKLVDVAVHSRHKLLPEIVHQIATDLGLDVDGPGQLLRDISERARARGSVVVVIDALDEAGSGTVADAGGKGEPRRIARELLRPLSEVPGVRLIVGTRRELVSSLGTAMQVLDLDDRKYLGGKDIAGYVTKVLLASNEPEVVTPYRNRPDLARQVGEAVAGRAAGVFLVARMTARGLRSATHPMDIEKPGWQDELPSEIGEAFEDYLSWFGPDEDRVRAMLTPLAFAEGQGLPRGTLWTGMSSVLGGRQFGENDIDWLLDKAAAYIAEVSDQDRSVYRLYHQALAEHLRAAYRPGQVLAQRRIVEALLATVPRTATGDLDWLAAHRYLHAHLSTHAAAARCLDNLVADPSFLLVAEQLALLRAFPQVKTADSRQARSAYEQVAHLLVAGMPLGDRAAYLQLSAHRCGAKDLADRIDTLKITMPWRTRWAWWSPTGVHRQLIGHTKAIRGLATGDMDGRPIVLTGGDDGTARIWDLITQRPIGEPIRHGSRSITALAVGEMGDYTIAVTGGDDSKLRLWDLSSGRPIDNPLEGHTNEITAIVLCNPRNSNKTLAISTSLDGTARVWDLTSGTQLGEPFTGHRRPVKAVAWTEVDGRILALTGGEDHQVQLWDAETKRPVGQSLIGHTKAVTAVALAEVNGQILVVTGSGDGTLGLWDLRSRQQVGAPLVAHEFGVHAVATGEVDGVPIAVSSGRTFTRVWNLQTRQQMGQPLAGQDGLVHSVLVGSVDRRPVAITGGTDRIARIWDLTADQPLSGHTDFTNCVAMRKVKGRCLAATGGNDTTVVLWDLDAGGSQDGPPLSGHRSAVTAVTLGEIDGRPAAVTGDEDATVLVWDLITRSRIGQKLVGHTGPVGAVTLYRSDGAVRLATGSKDGTVRLWDPVTGTLISPPLVGHNANVDMLAVEIVENHQLVIAAAKQGLATVWNLSTREPLEIQQPDPDRWSALDVGCIDRKAVALFVASDNTLLLWDLLAGQAIGNRMTGHTDSVTVGVLGELNGEPIATTGSTDGNVITWSLNSGHPLGPTLTSIFDYRSGLSLATGPTSQGTAAITVGRQIRLWSLTDFQQVGEALHGHENYTFCVTPAHSGDRKTIVTAGRDGTVRVHDLNSGKLNGPTLNGHEVFLEGVEYTELNGPVAVSAGQLDCTIRIWDLTTYRERFHWAYKQNMRFVYDTQRTLAIYDRNKKPTLTIAAGPEIQVWDLASRSLLAELTGHTGRVRSIVVGQLNGTPVALTGSVDSTARLWNLDTLTALDPPLTGHDGEVVATWGQRLGEVVAFTGDGDGVVRAWNPVTGQLLESSIPPAQKWIECLSGGELHGHPVLAIGSGDGTIRLWCQTTNHIIAQLELNTTPHDVVMFPDGDVCVATGMGVLTLNIQDWMKETQG
ncbi:WD40 repeat protein [Kibdelosporangium banguiense]|uniref:WD40 repeat protein n=1 Tax=Kibdelosporangium banguiense TaxID=1365924 RepID=A0ABS4U197_9PSEU|nr:caspase family protein [Kibdelosporangium banguiense]MBP2330008.1 WD40 repeat protein [Kibdelosporangium banguiense]